MDELALLAHALKASDQSGKSAIVAEYERSLCTHFRVRHAIALSSGTAALHAALVSVGCGVNSKVLVSAAAPLPTLMPILAAGATPLFSDCLPGSPAIDPQRAKEAILGGAVSAAIEVSLWGYPQDYSALRTVLNEHQIPLIEDAAQAHGSRVSNGFVGTAGEIGCFSTHSNKLLSSGEGGFVLTDDGDYFERMLVFSRIGNLDGVSGGVNYKMSAFAAAVATHRLGSLDRTVELRRANAKEIAESLRPHTLGEVVHSGEPNGYALALLMKPESVHGRIAARLAAEGLPGDRARYGYKPGPEHALFRTSAVRQSYPNAIDLTTRAVQLPTDRPAGLVVSAFQRAYRAARDSHLPRSDAP